MKILQVLVLILGVTVLAKAQEVILTGTIYDFQGAVIPNSKIVATNKNSKVFKTTTNEDGIYKLKLKPGIYAIQVPRLPGLKGIKFNDYRILITYDGKMNLDISLDIGSPKVHHGIPVKKSLKQSKTKNKFVKRKIINNE